MTQRVQSRLLSEAETDKELAKDKLKAECNMGLLLLVFNSLNKLCEILNGFNYVFIRRNIKQILYHKCKGVKK